MTTPTVSAAAEQVWRLLPDYAQAADERTDWTLRRFTAAAAAGLDRAVDLLTAIDPNTSVTGTCEIVNPQAAPRSFLPWLGWLVGIDTSLLPDSEVRAVIKDTFASQRRGSVAAIAAAVQRTLTGVRDVTILTKPPDPDITAWDYDVAEDYDTDRRYDGQVPDPWLIIVITKTPQTPDATATLEAALSEKPAGMLLELQTLAGMTYDALAALYPTYSGMKSTNRTYGDLASSFT
jgi:hypothetical protein